MIPAPFTYFAPRSLPEALDLLQQHGSEAKVMAGGQSLIPLMKLRLASPGYVIDLGRVPGLDTLEERDGELVIGAMVRESTVENSPLLRQRYTGLVEASEVVADPLVRNVATLGGNLAHADPANDHPAMMLALRGQILAVGPTSERRIPIDDFLVGTFETSLAADEVLVEIRIPRPAPHTGSAYIKLERKVGDYAIAAVAAQVTLDGETCVQAGLGLTNAGPTAIRPIDAEQCLVGKRIDEEVIHEAARLAAAAADPSSDLRGPAEYKRGVLRTLTARALRQATRRALEGVSQ
jgi:carbon-monoxide dehydrogenase medium subunit